MEKKRGKPPKNQKMEDLNQSEGVKSLAPISKASCFDPKLILSGKKPIWGPILNPPRTFLYYK